MEPVTLYVHGRLFNSYDIIRVVQGESVTLRLVPSIRRKEFANLASATEIRFVVRDGDGNTVITKTKADAKVDHPQQGSVEYTLTPADTSQLSPGAYRAALLLRFPLDEVYEWRLTNSIFAGRSMAY